MYLKKCKTLDIMANGFSYASEIDKMLNKFPILVQLFN